MNILGLSFDADGCLYHLRYHDVVKLSDLSERSSQEKERLYEKILIEENRSFLTEIKTKVSEADLAYTFVGSLRQDYDIDVFNSKKDTYSTDSFFNSIKTINDEIGSELVPLLMADIFDGFIVGYSFTQAIEAHTSLGIVHASSKADQAKVIILYAQMHYLACRYPNDDITFSFFDDRQDILQPLHAFFLIASHWIPNNVTLRLHCYAGKDISVYPAFEGTGDIDPAYRETVQLMALIVESFRNSKREESTLNAVEHINRSKIETLRLLRSQQPEHIKKNLPQNLVDRHLLRHLIVHEDNLREVRILISKNNALIEQFDCDGATPLHLAVIFDRTEIAKYLITNGADFLARTPAVSNKYKSRRYSIDSTAIDLALKYKRESIVSIVIDVLVSKYTFMPLDKHSLAEFKMMIKKCPQLIHIKDGLSQTLLLFAASRGRSPIVAFLLEQGADINPETNNPKRLKEHRRTALDWAIVGGYADIVLMLVNAKARANHLHEVMNAFSWPKLTAAIAETQNKHRYVRHGMLGFFNAHKANLGAVMENGMDSATSGFTRMYQIS